MVSKLQNSTPLQDGFWMPAEWEAHKGCWMVFPERLDTWRQNAVPAQKVYAQVANAISQFEPITMVVSKKSHPIAKKLLNSKVKIVEFENDDAWMRDIGPTFVKNKKGEIRGVDWIFNAWGGKVYAPWDKDDRMAQNVCNYVGVDHYRAPLILEGGSIHSDGDGTIYTTEECLLNPNRNPNLTKAQIEQHLKNYLGAKKIIWLPWGVYKDETNGHVDNVLMPIKPGKVFLTWTDDQNDPQYKRSLENLKFLEKEKDAKGRKIEVVKLYQPNPMPERTALQTQGIVFSTRVLARRPHDRLPASYANFYISTKAIILPIFGVQESDQKAIMTIQKEFPNHKVVPIISNEILLGGGNIHCITQQQIK